MGWRRNLKACFLAHKMSSVAAAKDADLLDRFRGAMVGAVVGDALGAPLEFVSPRPLPAEVVGRHFAKLRKEERDGVRKYTDDTAMARQVADSLVAKGGLDQWDLARRFASEYLSEPHRGYGRGAMDVLDELGSLTGVTGWEGGEDRLVRDDPTGPASAQFGGRGSYGNGAAMRTHPVALHCAGTEDRAALEEVAKGQALLTHAHKDGYRGAILQAYAVWLALRGTPSPEFVQRVQQLVRDFKEEEEEGEEEGADGGEDDARPTYRKAMEVLERCLKNRDDKAALELGNDVTALHSVPSAIYSALRARDEDDGGGGTEKHGGTFERTLRLAYSYGGDTDTIGSMAGAIAGAFCGAGAIPPRLARQCEGVEDAARQAEELHRAVTESKEDSAEKRRRKRCCSKEGGEKSS